MEPSALIPKRRRRTPKNTDSPVKNKESATIQPKSGYNFGNSRTTSLDSVWKEPSRPNLGRMDGPWRGQR